MTTLSLLLYWNIWNIYSNLGAARVSRRVPTDALFHSPFNSSLAAEINWLRWASSLWSGNNWQLISSFFESHWRTGVNTRRNRWRPACGRMARDVSWCAHSAGYQFSRKFSFVPSRALTHTRTSFLRWRSVQLWHEILPVDQPTVRIVSSSDCCAPAVMEYAWSKNCWSFIFMIIF